MHPFVSLMFFSFSGSSSGSIRRFQEDFLHISSKKTPHVDVFQVILRLAFDLI